MSARGAVQIQNASFVLTPEGVFAMSKSGAAAGRTVLHSASFRPYALVAVDRGCRFAPKCSRCPWAVCRFELGAEDLRAFSEAWDRVKLDLAET